MSGAIRRTILLSLPLCLAATTADAREVTCESKDFQRQECDMNTRGEVQLVRQLSKTRCVEGRNYGFNRRSVWVDQGCAAVFAEDPEYASVGRQRPAGRPSLDQIAACNGHLGRYDSEVVSSTPLKPGAWEIILEYSDGQYVCDVNADNEVEAFEKLRHPLR
jgi:hypothetical protein